MTVVENVAVSEKPVAKEMGVSRAHFYDMRMSKSVRALHFRKVEAFVWADNDFDGFGIRIGNSDAQPADLIRNLVEDVEIDHSEFDVPGSPPHIDYRKREPWEVSTISPSKIWRKKFCNVGLYFVDENISPFQVDQGSFRNFSRFLRGISGNLGYPPHLLAGAVESPSKIPNCTGRQSRYQRTPPVDRFTNRPS
jgi:hypothetical protein